MKKHIILLFALLFCLSTAFAQQNGIHAFQAAQFIGKTVRVTAKVITVTTDSTTHLISIGLSDWRNKTDVLTLIVHSPDFTEKNLKGYKDLTGQMITFTGKIKKHKNHPFIYTESSKLTYSTVIAIDEP